MAHAKTIGSIGGKIARGIAVIRQMLAATPTPTPTHFGTEWDWPGQTGPFKSGFRRNNNNNNST